MVSAFNVMLKESLPTSQLRDILLPFFFESFLSISQVDLPLIWNWFLLMV